MKQLIAVVLSMALAGSVIAAQAQQGTATAPTTKTASKKGDYQSIGADHFDATQ